MRLVRFAFLNFKTATTDWFREPWTFEIDEIILTTEHLEKNEEKPKTQKILCIANISLSEWPEKTESRGLLIPEVERKKAEEAIEKVANLISISEHCQKTISSPHPCVAIYPESVQEWEWLEKSSGIISNRSMIPEALFRLKLDQDLLDATSDRQDGVALLSEALANNHATGKYREFIRFFECAFGTSVSQIKKKLAQFLEKSDLGYNREEIQKWLSLRNAAIHADKNKDLVFESGVLKLIPRMEQAVYDILLNKKRWGERSQERREIWKPKTATTDYQPSLMFTKGDNSKVLVKLLDEFQSFAFDFQGGIAHMLSNTLWSKWENQTDPSEGNTPAWASRFHLEVRPEPK